MTLRHPNHPLPVLETTMNAMLVINIVMDNLRVLDQVTAIGSTELRARNHSMENDIMRGIFCDITCNCLPSRSGRKLIADFWESNTAVDMFLDWGI